MCEYLWGSVSEGVSLKVGMKWGQWQVRGGTDSCGAYVLACCGEDERDVCRDVPRVKCFVR